MVAGEGDASPKLRDLLVAEPSPTLADDATIARAVARAGAEGDAAICLRVRNDDGGQSFAVLTLGSNRRVTWAEVGASKAAMGALARALVTR